MTFMTPQNDFDYIEPKFIPRKTTPKQKKKVKNVSMKAKSRYGKDTNQISKDQVTVKFYP